MQGDLTTLAPVKAWLGLTNDASDAVVNRLISQCSRAILDHLQRPSFLSQVYTDQMDGRDNATMYLDNWPVTAVSALTVDDGSVPAALGTAAGWKLQPWNGYPPGNPQALHLVGYCYARGKLNVSATYTAGYLVQGEAQVIPATPFQLTTLNPQGNWAADAGVTKADGTPLVKVSASPATGQYSVDAAGKYTFAAADTGQTVLISYSYVPASVEDACISWVAERYKRQSRIGIRSESAGGQQTVSYDTSDIPAYIKTELQPFRRVLPT